MDGHTYYPRSEDDDSCGNCGLPRNSHNVLPPYPQSNEVTAQLSAALQQEFLDEVEKLEKLRERFPEM